MSAISRTKSQQCAREHSSAGPRCRRRTRFSRHVRTPSAPRWIPGRDRRIVTQPPGGARRYTARAADRRSPVARWGWGRARANCENRDAPYPSDGRVWLLDPCESSGCARCRCDHYLEQTVRHQRVRQSRRASTPAELRASLATDSSSTISAGTTSTSASAAAPPPAMATRRWPCISTRSARPSARPISRTEGRAD